MQIELIVAMSENGVIGVNNQLPWHLPDDLKYFKKTTLGKAVLMGRKTYESIGKPLPGRTNLILSQDPAYQAPGCRVVNSIEESLDMAKAVDALVIIGGATVYRAFLAYAEIMHVTLVHTQIEGDTFFPAFDREQWQLKTSTLHAKDEAHGFAFTIQTYHHKGLSVPMAG